MESKNIRSISSTDALKKHITVHTFFPAKQMTDLDLALANCLPSIEDIITDKMDLNSAVNFQLRVKLLLQKYSFSNDKICSIEAFFPSTGKTVLNLLQIVPALQKSMIEVLQKFDSFVQEGSGWSLMDVLEVEVTLNRYRIFHGGCLKSDLPPALLKSRGILIPTNCTSKQKDDCFLYAVALALSYPYKDKNPSRLNFQDLRFVRKLRRLIKTFPVDLKILCQLEKRLTKFSINVYGFENESKLKHIFPYYISPFAEKREKHVNLLLYREHYFAISNLSPLVKQNLVRNKRKSYVCNFCLTVCSSIENLNLHKSLCQENGKHYRFPTQKTFQTFTSYKNLYAAPFVIYIDLESAMKTKEQINIGKQISKVQHECISWACLTVCRPNPDFNSAPVIYTGKDAVSRLLDYLEGERKRVLRILKNVNVPLSMTDDDIFKHVDSEVCQVCKNFYFDDKLFPEAKVRDHCHLSGKYRGALCNSCNLRHAVYKPEIICIFHGLSNYDSHFLIPHLSRYRSNILCVIPKTSEKFLSFSIGNLIFKDSYNFLAERLQVLAENLEKKGKENFKNVLRYVKSSEKRKILRSKGVFPYSYIDSEEKLEEKSLPSKDKFFNDLCQRDISEEEYEHAKTVWKLFSCKTLKDYLHVYLLGDVLILADVFENFRTMSLRDYELDPCHYFSGAHFTMDAFLRKCNPEIELLNDVNMYLMFSNCIRGGLSMVCKRVSTANNKYLEKFDPKLPSKYILYIDANNLYGHAMRNNLPYKDFAWCDPSDLNLLSKILNSSIEETMEVGKEEQIIENQTGYLLEVDLDYPEELHDLHSDFPLAPEKNSKTFSQLSPFAQYLCQKHNLTRSTNCNKLLATLENKRNYTVYYKNLILYLKLGLQLKKVHKIISFTETCIMKDYIDFNSRKRASATNAFDINFFKFLSNSLFGKTMERPDNRSILKLISDISTYEKNVCKLNFKSSKIITKDLVSIELAHPVFVINKPFYIGAVILELAKFHMYNFHYNVMKKNFKESIRLLYTDTDSFIYEICCEDIFLELRKLNNFFDFSNFPKDNPLYNTLHKKVPGYFKDETGSKQIKSFIGLRSKMYAIKIDSAIKHEIKAAKGVKKYVIDQNLNFQDYEMCLLESKQEEHEFLTIRSKSHQVYTSHESKISLSPFDDKRWLLNSSDSIAYGHKSLLKKQTEEGNC